MHARSTKYTQHHKINIEHIINIDPKNASKKYTELKIKRTPIWNRDKNHNIESSSKALVSVLQPRQRNSFIQHAKITSSRQSLFSDTFASPYSY